MEKKMNSKRSISECSSSSSSSKKVIETKDFQISQDQANNLIGTIVEKCVSSQNPNFAPSPVAPTVLPFPVARHRSHGPHWAPLNRNEVGDNENDDENEDNDLTEFGKVSASANPIKRKQKKNLDLSKWRELIQGDKSRGSHEKAEDKFLLPEKPKKIEEVKSLTSDEVTTVEMDVEPKNGPGYAETVADMELENSEPFYPNNFRSNRGSMTLESEIDAENRARLEGMSPDEIAKAQAEIMHKMSPALIESLKKLGRDKSKNFRSSSSGMGIEGSRLAENGTSHMEAKATIEAKRAGPSNAAIQNLDPKSNNLWEAWSKRVEAIRKLRFSLDGNVIDLEPDIGNDFVDNRYCAGNVTERDFLRTEGDPGAAGYTIKEALALTKSVVPGQRAIALYLFASVLDKALYNINEKNADNVDGVIDWEAVWAFALGPEPELVLSLRMCLDDNHTSVVFACAKVIECILSCAGNEKFFDISEKLASYDKDICTAPVFRNRPEIQFGFLHGGFWKYNAKPSNILPFAEDTVEDEAEEEHTIKDDIVVGEQDFAAGLVRMGLLPRLCYLLEMDPNMALEESILSILVAIARHSPTCANAVISCPRLVKTIVDRFSMKDKMEITNAKIKSVTLLKVLARSDKSNCSQFIKSGVFRDMTWHLCKYSFSLDHWLKSGSEHCKVKSALMIEQLRFWKVCIQYGYCVSYFADLFPALCFWLNPPTFEKLVENNLLTEFASVVAESYLVLEALAKKLPNIYSTKHSHNLTRDVVGDTEESWSWSHVGPMVDIALKWIGLRSDSLLLSPLLWVSSAVIHMLSTVLERVNPHDSDSLPWVPEFVPKIGLAIIKNVFLGSFIEKLCHLRHESDYETSVASVSCLHGLVRVTVSVDNLVNLAKSGNYTPSPQTYNVSEEGKILEEGLLMWSLSGLRSTLGTFTQLISSERQFVQSIEFFSRGGPAPGSGLGWGASGGGFWSKTVLLAQIDATLLIDLLEIFQSGSTVDEDMSSFAQRISSAMSACLVLGPRDRAVTGKLFDILVQVPVLKYLDLCIRHSKPFGWEYKVDELTVFSKALAFHFKNRWLSIKQKSKSAAKAKLSDQRNSLDTIHEDLVTSDTPNEDNRSGSLVTEWAHQRLPLPNHWFLSPISTTQVNTDSLEVAKGGLFFLLGIEAVSSFQFSPVRTIPLIWKLHSLSMSLLNGMCVLEDEKSRDVFEALQELYGQLLDESRLVKNEELVLLRFQTEIHEGYDTYIDTLVEQFAATSYGDAIYGRQVSIYLHRCVDSPVRLAAWNALSNARVLELLPPLDKCVAEANGYLEPVEDNEGILEAYAKSWVSGALERAATRGSISYTLVLHHLSCFIFSIKTGDKLLLRNKIAKSLLRDYSRRPKHEGMLLDFIGYQKPSLHQNPEQKVDPLLSVSEIEQRFVLLSEACEGNSSLLSQVEKLKSSFRK